MGSLARVHHSMALVSNILKSYSCKTTPHKHIMLSIVDRMYMYSMYPRFVTSGCIRCFIVGDAACDYVAVITGW